jgi:hypothetical protein
VRRDTAPETRHGCPLMTWELFVLNFARKCWRILKQVHFEETI